MSTHSPDTSAGSPGQVARTTIDGDVIEWLDVPQRAALLDLAPHPEGGWYRRTWAGVDPVDTPNGKRPAATLIYFLLPPGEFSAWHVVTSDETWLWHGPGTVQLQLGGTGATPEPGEILSLGPDEASGQRAQGLVPAGVWQRTIPTDSEALVSCIVSPGFSFDDWSLED